MSDLYRTAMGIVSSHVLGGLVRLGVPDVLDGDGMIAAEAAGRVGVSDVLLARLLRAAVALDAVVEVAPGRFALTESGRTLRRDDPSSTGALVQLINEPSFARAWGPLENQLRTGRTAFDTANGEALFRYLAGDPELQTLFNTAMRSWTVRSTGPLAERAGFERFGTVVDVGGGDGSLLAAVLAAHPTLRGIVFDSPEGAQRAPDTLRAQERHPRLGRRAGRRDPAELPRRPAGERAGTGRGDGTAGHDAARAPDFSEVPYLFDIVMMLVVGGQERSRADYTALFGKAGLELTDMVEASPETGVCVLEAVNPSSGRSFSGFRTAQTLVTRSPATSNAMTATVACGGRAGSRTRCTRRSPPPARCTAGRSPRSWA